MIPSPVFLILTDYCFSSASCAVLTAVIPSFTSLIVLFDSYFSGADFAVTFCPGVIPFESYPAFLSVTSLLCSTKSPYNTNDIGVRGPRSICKSVLVVLRHINAPFLRHKVSPITLSHGYP